MTIEGYDASTAPSNPPPGDQVAMLYIGGDTPHVATLAEWNSQPARYRLPIWTRDNPAGRDGAAEGRAALAKLDQLGAPRGILIGLDYETAVDAAFVAAFDGVLAAGGNKTVLYGSKSSVFRNPRPSGGYWTADLTGRPHQYPGAVITQWEFETGWDDDTLTAGLPLWDTRPDASTPATTVPAATTTRRNDMHIDLKLNTPVVFTNPAAALGGTSTMLLATDFGPCTVRVATFSFKAGKWTVAMHEVSDTGGAVSLPLPADVNKVSVNVVKGSEQWPVGLDVLA